MQTVKEVLDKSTAFLLKAGIENPKIDAEWLIAHGLNCKRLELFLQFDRPLEESVLAELRALIKRRSQREPLQLIIGNVEFCDLKLEVEAGVLIPRPETEELVELVLQRSKGLNALKVIDLGTGTGAIALALGYHIKDGLILGIDNSATALRLAKRNAQQLGLADRVKFRQGDWLKGIESKVNWVVSNPPYLTEEEWIHAAPEVKSFDPRSALVAEDSGLAEARKILEASTRVLETNGRIGMELGIDQPQALKEFAENLGYTNVELIDDFHRRQRYFFADWAF